MKKLIFILSLFLTAQILFSQKTFTIGNNFKPINENYTMVNDTIVKSIAGSVEIDRHIYKADELKLVVKYTLDSTTILDKNGNKYETSKCSKKDCIILHLNKKQDFFTLSLSNYPSIQVDTILLGNSIKYYDEEFQKIIPEN